MGVPGDKMEIFIYTTRKNFRASFTVKNGRAPLVSLRY